MPVPDAHRCGFEQRTADRGVESYDEFVVEANGSQKEEKEVQEKKIAVERCQPIDGAGKFT